MKKIIKVFLSIIFCFSFVGCKEEKTIEMTDETITIHFTIVDKTESEEVLFDQEIQVSANVETLEDVILNASQLEAITDKGPYGITIVSLMGKESNWDRGPWWFINSENNTSCVKAGYCEGASNIIVEDGDHFTFSLTSEY